MKPKALSGIFYIIWYLIALIIVLFAIAVSVLHFVTPNLNRHKDYIQQWVSKTLGMPVKIDRIQAHWDGIRPEVDLYGVTLSPSTKNASTSVGQITLNNLHIELNLTKALFALSLQPTGIFATGLNLHVTSMGHEGLSINNLMSTSSRASGVRNVRLDRLIAWLQSQHLLVLSQSNLFLQFKNHQGVKSNEHFYIKNLRVANNGYLHELYMTVSQQANAASSIDLGIRAHGDLTQLSKLTVSAYADFHNVAFQDWWQQPIEGYQVKHALVDGQVWLNWDKQHFQTSQLDLSLSGLKVYALKRQNILPLEQFSGHVAWQPTAKGWLLLGNRVGLIVNQDAWPETSFSFDQEHGTQLLHWGYVDLHDAWQFSQSVATLPKTWVDPINQTQPTGVLSDIVFSHRAAVKAKSASFDFNAMLNNVAVLPYQKFPALSGVNGLLVISPKSGSFALTSDNLVLNSPRFFTHSVTAGVAKANISWHKKANAAWLIKAEDVSAVNEDGAIAGSFALRITHGSKNPVVSAMFGYHERDPAKIKQYFPERFFDKSLSDWLNQAFLAGQPSSGTFVMRGLLHDYPYTNHQGIFIVDALIPSLQLQYAPDWPVLNNLGGELIFRNNSMFAKGSHADIYNTQIHQLSASIPVLIRAKNGPVLNIAANANGSFGDIFKYLNESPLHKILGSGVKKLAGSGPASTSLKLLIPLDHPKHTQVDGNTHVDAATFELPSWKMTLDQLTGDIHFTENGLSSNHLSANFLGFPTTMSLQTVTDPHHHMILQGNMVGQTSIAALVKAFNMPAFPEVTGQTNYTAQLNLRGGSADKTPSSLAIQTNLKGIAIHLPAPIGAATDSVSPLSINAYFSQHAPLNVFFKYKTNEYLTQGALAFHSNASQSLKFYSGDVVFGNHQPVIQKAPGLVVSGYLPNLNWQAWSALYDVKKKQYQEQQANPQETHVAMIPRLVSLTIGKLSVLGQTFSPIDIKFESLLDHYSLGISSQAIDGSVNIPTNYPKGTLTANFVRLHVNTPDKSDKTASVGSKINPAGLPPMQIGITDFQLGKKPIGGVYFESVPEKNAMLIKRLEFMNHLFSGKVTGAWSLIAGQYHTSLSGYLSTDNLTDLNKVWGLTSSLEARAGNLRFLLGWAGAPYQFAMEKLTGNAVINLGGGTVLINSASTAAKLNLGRIISLLSIDNIFTGFTGLAKKGYGFDVMHAEAAFHQGVVGLSNTYFQGPVARLDFSGEVNMLKKVLNLNLTVTPHVTSSLPVIAGIATLNPLIGVATYVADKIFSPALNSVVSRRYLVKGKYSNPVIVPLSKAPAKSSMNPASENSLLRN